MRNAASQAILQLLAVCRSRPQKPRKSSPVVSHLHNEEYPLCVLRTGRLSQAPLKVTVFIDGQAVEMEVDMGAAVSVISRETL